MIRLGVNVDHVCTLRQARGEVYPSPIKAALFAEAAGASNITCHLREDRRHIQDDDVRLLRETCQLPLNFEMAARREMLDMALSIKPHTVTLVPEKRQELTTEGGLSVQDIGALGTYISELKGQGIRVALFVDPNLADIEVAQGSGAQAIELHTGTLAHALDRAAGDRAACRKLVEEFAGSCRAAADSGLHVHVGHGLHYQNAFWLQLIPEIEEANIGHAIVAEAVFCGFSEAVRRMLALLNDPAYCPRFPGM